MTRTLIRTAALVAALAIAGCLAEGGGEEDVIASETQGLCYGYCADGHFVCPPNPQMECYWECTLWCTAYCDEGEEPPPCWPAAGVDAEDAQAVPGAAP
jgi:hypothetical protein